MVKESSIPFDIPRKLTEEELQETVKYCRHDVEQTVEVFMQRKADFDAIMSLIKMFPEVLSIRDIGLTKAQISAKILECEKVRRNDEFDLFVLPCIQIKKYRKAIDFYMSMVGKTNQKEVYSESLNMIISCGNTTSVGVESMQEKKNIRILDMVGRYGMLMLLPSIQD